MPQTQFIVNLAAPIGLVEMAMMLESELGLDLDLDFIDAQSTLNDVVDGIMTALANS